MNVSRPAAPPRPQSGRNPRLWAGRYGPRPNRHFPGSLSAGFSFLPENRRGSPESFSNRQLYAIRHSQRSQP